MKKKSLKAFTYSSRGSVERGPFHHFLVFADSQEKADEIVKKHLDENHVIVCGLTCGKIIKEEFEIKDGAVIFLPA
jgi:hypothetical protein